MLKDINITSKGGKQKDGPDEPVVNTEEQNKLTNPENDNKEKSEDILKKRGYKEGNRDDSNTEEEDTKKKSTGR